MTGLMYYRPDDHIDYLLKCLEKVKAENISSINWNLFIDQRRKTPLPPITPNGENGRVQSLSREPSFVTQNTLESMRASPLPPIGSNSHTGSVGTIKIPDCPLVLVMGGPGSGKADQCKFLVDKYKGWVHLSMGGLLRAERKKHGSPNKGWNQIGSLMDSGDMVPENVVLDLLKQNLEKCGSAAGVLIEGFPRTADQAQQYNDLVGRVDLVFVLDSEESTLRESLNQRKRSSGRKDDTVDAIESRLAFFRENTLPVIKHYDDEGRLVIIDGERAKSEVQSDLTTLFENIFFNGSKNAKGTNISHSGQPHPPPSPKPSSPRPGSGRYSRTASRSGSTLSRPASGFSRVDPEPDIEVADTGRKDDMPTCPIIFVMGGPGSGRSEQCEMIVARYPGSVQVSMGEILREQTSRLASSDTKWSTIKRLMDEGNMVPEDVTTELLLPELKKHSSATAIILNGFPRTKEQVELFNASVGGLTTAILLDSDDHHMKKRLRKRRDMSGRTDDAPQAVTNRLTYYKHHTLPVIGYLDGIQQLIVVNTDRDSDDVFVDVSAELDKFMRPSSKPTNLLGVAIKIPDEGRRNDMPPCPIIAIIGVPGGNADEQARKVAEDKFNFTFFSLTDQTVTGSELTAMMSASVGAEGIVLHGSPINQQQVEDFNKYVGGMDGVIVIDCGEEYSVSTRGVDTATVKQYKKNVLPVLAHYDDFGKLTVVNGERSGSEIFDDLSKAIEEILAKKKTFGVTSKSSDSSLERIEVNVPDQGRQPGLPTNLIVAVIGGPNSATDSQCKQVTEKFPGSVHVAAQGMSGTELETELKKTTDAKLVVIEGYPQSKQQLEEFNKQIGGLSRVIVIDSCEMHLKTSGADADAIKAYSKNTLPVLAYIEDMGKLDVVSSCYSIH
ncbi:hypothetical protein NP493_268g03045 [Ridgeia piscesae]|uniref:Adenylate kinase n=1 Tax=Ridgeia piscesae TaxID=27915 RepID=A0AAD9NXN5_RIDPI|nr:hypothetical protein NP493_268g03045 [Ridgeia piscesae]